ncbi:hypothetical protein DUNSADRAFT_11159 [Dunaliella salina]|uniref:Encoded protein n=1 Tax=Dunaliella salina TaxID=3046 RepID=A0ABQ7GE65_DUNSA|nr:hypothetical protein DUNSADRAFT_11159 [Dunaliella salina]|eukprot:KAF5832857.1 hypothetical protein DUNSADRAFT_11159 [Dunaliella salina]
MLQKEGAYAQGLDPSTLTRGPYPDEGGAICSSSFFAIICILTTKGRFKIKCKQGQGVFCQACSPCLPIHKLSSLPHIALSFRVCQFPLSIGIYIIVIYIHL